MSVDACGAADRVEYKGEYCGFWECCFTGQREIPHSVLVARPRLPGMGRRGGGGDLRAYIVAEAMIIPTGYSMYSIFYRCGHDGAWRDRQETGWEWEWKRGRRVLREDPVDRRPLGSRGKQKPTSRATLFGCGQKKKERERKRKAPSITHSLTDPSRLGSASRAGGGGNNGLYSHSVYVCVHAFYFYFWSRTRTQPHSK